MLTTRSVIRSASGAVAAIGLTVLFASSCAFDSGRDAVPIRTDRDRYVLQPSRFGHEAMIVVHFTSPKDTIVHIIHCNGAISWGIQRLDGDQWMDAWIATMNACLSPPIVVQEGEVYTDTLGLISRTDVSTTGPIQHEIQPGTYRVVFHNVLTSFDMNSRPLARNSRWRNAFRARSRSSERLKAAFSRRRARKCSAGFAAFDRRSSEALDG